MNKKFKIIYSVIFMAICTVPLLLMPFFKNDISLEKRELTEFPSFISEGKLNVDFSGQFESWVNDRIPFRACILSAANYVKADMFEAASSNVISGKDGWLYFESEAADYMNTNAVSDHEVKSSAVTLSLMQESVEAKGGHFTFVTAPNKASVYEENMPSRYKRSEVNNLTRITDEAKKLGVNVTDLRSVLRDNKDKDLYHVRDSHWNYQGALLGYNAIMDSLGRDHDSHEGAEYTKEKTWRGDLDKLLYPAGGFMDYQYNYNIRHSKFMFTVPAGVKDAEAQLENFMSDKEQGDDLFSTRNLEKNDGSRLFMARDSFGRALLPYMIDSYSEVTFKRTDCPDITSLADGTDVVYEIVERNLNKVIAKAPFMYAPQRQEIAASYTDGKYTSGSEAKLTYEALGYAGRIYGVLPEDMEDGDGRVYILLEKSGETLCYEAFPIYEAELLEADTEENREADIDNNSEAETAEDKSFKESRNGFSAYISKDENLKGQYQVSIIAGDKTYAAGNIEF